MADSGCFGAREGKKGGNSCTWWAAESCVTFTVNWICTLVGTSTVFVHPEGTLEDAWSCFVPLERRPVPPSNPFVCMLPLIFAHFSDLPSYFSLKFSSSKLLPELCFTNKMLDPKKIKRAKKKKRTINTVNNMSWHHKLRALTKTKLQKSWHKTLYWFD